MTFWGYLVLIFLLGLTLEDYQCTKHHLEMERIELIHKLNRRMDE